MSERLNGWSEWVKALAIILPVLGTGFVAYYRLGNAEEAVAKTQEQNWQQDRQITQLQEREQAIKEGLDDIKEAIQSLNSKIDRIR